MVEFSTWLQDVYTNRNYDISLVDHNESHDFYQWADPTHYYNYDNKEVQALYAKAVAATNDDDRDKLLAEAARKVSEDAPADWLFNYRVTTRTRRASPASRSTSTRPCCRCTTSPTPSDG